MPIASKLSREEIVLYRATARRRRNRELREVAERQKRAWEVARRAAALLKRKFGVTRVVVFGSLIHEGCFTRWSDVDIAAWGISPDATFRAIGAVMYLDPEIIVSLVDVETCRPSLLAVIEREGIEL